MHHIEGAYQVKLPSRARIGGAREVFEGQRCGVGDVEREVRDAFGSSGVVCSLHCLSGEKIDAEKLCKCPQRDTWS